jgi:nicotinamide phosphoribosyltransferase
MTRSAEHVRGGGDGGRWRDVSKAPTGDPMKHSKAGRLALQYVHGDYRTVRRESIPTEENLLQPVFRNGKLLRKWDFTELIARSEREVPEYYYADVIAPMISGR